MADGSSILAVLEELHDVEVEKLDKKDLKRQPRVLLSLQLVGSVKEKLISNDIMGDQVKEALSSTSDGDLEKCLKWLDDCLVKRGLHLSASREKAWTMYHQNLFSNLSDMTTVIQSRQAAAIIALHAMKELVTQNYLEPLPVQSGSQNISESEEEVIAYISGYLLKKFSHSPEAQALMSQDSDGLVALMDRGGLTQAKQSFIDVVRQLEVVFREMPKKSVDLAAFDSAVCGQNIPSHFFQLLESVDSSAQEKEHFFVGVMHLFFTVRAHQKCRHLIEKHILVTKKSRKSKPIRDSI